MCLYLSPNSVYPPHILLQHTCVHACNPTATSHRSNEPKCLCTLYDLHRKLRKPACVRASVVCSGDGMRHCTCRVVKGPLCLPGVGVCTCVFVFVCVCVSVESGPQVVGCAVRRKIAQTHVSRMHSAATARSDSIAQLAADTRTQHAHANIFTSPSSSMRTCSEHVASVGIRCGGYQPMHQQ